MLNDRSTCVPGAVYTAGCNTTIEGDVSFEFNLAGTFGGERAFGIPIDSRREASGVFGIARVSR